MNTKYLLIFYYSKETVLFIIAKKGFIYIWRNRDFILLAYS